MIKLRHIFSILVSTLLLSGCQHMELLNPKGVIAADEKHLLVTAVLLMLVVVIPVIILTIAIAWKYRASNASAKYEPNWSHNTWLELVWWAIPCVIIVILAIITWVSSHQLDPYRPLDVKAKPLTVEVVALNWKWLFIYPDQKIATVNFLQVPVDQPVTFLITADAPMNSFQIPQLAGQIYAMPGMRTKLHIMANEIGDYRGFSANFSGDGFANMMFTVRVSSQKDFDKWVQTVKHSPNKLTMTAYDKLAQPSESVPVTYYASATDNLFNNIIMQFMMPMKSMQMDPSGRDAKTHLNY